MRQSHLSSAPRWTVLLFIASLGVSACARTPVTDAPVSVATPNATLDGSKAAPDPDPRVGLSAGLFDADEAIWNLELLSSSAPPETFVGTTNSDLAFKDNYAIQGNFNGILVWDISNPAAPALVTEYLCPASQSDVSVYQNLLFVSGEGLEGRLDCGTQGVTEKASEDRLRGIRIFDITDIENPEYIANVQTCRGSHTHSVLKDPDDDENVYVYVSGSAPVRPAEELPGCSAMAPDEDPNSALFRIEVIKVPLAAPETSAIVSSPRIFEDLVEPPTHGLAPDDIAALEEARAKGAFIAEVFGQERIIPDRFVAPILKEFAASRGNDVATAEDSAAFREALPSILAERFGARTTDQTEGPQPGPTQCHDITLYPEIGLAGGACEGYGLLLDISDPVNPVRIDAVADSNFAYWHSATFNNDGSKVLFTDEWGGGMQPKCRATDPMEWGANALFTVEDREMHFESYYKIPAAQTRAENCVAHNGSLIPIPGRDVMVQSWYQGGISVFDWTDTGNPVEIAYHDRGPIDSDRFVMGGSWSVYWYNGFLVSSEIARGLDIFELTPSDYLSANEIAAANTVELSYLNAQGQPRYVWPPSFSLAHAYLDQLERSGALSPKRIADARKALEGAAAGTGETRSALLRMLEWEMESAAATSKDATKVGMLAEVVRKLAG
jgi:hypothetical protein